MWFLHPRDIDVLESFIGEKFPPHERRNQGGDLRPSLSLHRLSSDYRIDRGTQEAMKHQVPSTKLQIISNYQNSKFQTKSFWSLDIGIWNLFGICDLDFGI